MSIGTGAAFTTAGGNVIVNRFVKPHTTAHQVVQGTANSAVCGVAPDDSGEAPLPSYTTDPPYAGTAGKAMKVYRPGDVCRLAIGSGGCSVGSLLESDSNGKGVIAATTAGTVRYIGARALTAASDGDSALVEVVFFTKTNPAA